MKIGEISNCRHHWADGQNLQTPDKGSTSSKQVFMNGHMTRVQTLTDTRNHRSVQTKSTAGGFQATSWTTQPTRESHTTHICKNTLPVLEISDTKKVRHVSTSQAKPFRIMLWTGKKNSFLTWLSQTAAHMPSLFKNNYYSSRMVVQRIRKEDLVA